MSKKSLFKNVRRKVKFIQVYRLFLKKEHQRQTETHKFFLQGDKNCVLALLLL